ncbi:MAG TPA: DUF899 family protein, partial [Stellaceae bacterium]|nr:DUF899 family protein [Stellaceae bacterium]
RDVGRLPDRTRRRRGTGLSGGAPFGLQMVPQRAPHIAYRDHRAGSRIFYRDETGAIFHTYSSFARGGEVMLGAYALLDMTPKGRNEKSNLTDWVRLHDRYEAGGPEGGER